MIAIALALTALVATAVNVALVPFVADRLSPQINGSVATDVLVASNENSHAVTTLAA